jgi:uncharacterized protein YegP (UPF0339 family)
MTKIVRALGLSLALIAIAGLAGPPFATGQVKKDKGGAKAAATAVFEVYKDTQGKYRFRLKDDEGTLLAMSVRGYETKADCQKIIAAIRTDAAKAKLEDADTVDKKTVDKKTEDKKTKDKKDKK